MLINFQPKLLVVCCAPMDLMWKEIIILLTLESSYSGNDQTLRKLIQIYF